MVIAQTDYDLWHAWLWEHASVHRRTCTRCGRIARASHARFCAQCGLRLRRTYNPDASAYSRALERGRRLRDLGPAWFRLANRSFREAMRRRPEEIEPALEIARTYYQAGQLRRSKRWYHRVIRRQRNCFDAWVEGADCFARYAHFRRARWLRRALTLRPGDPAVLRELGRHLVRLRGWRRWWIERGLWRLCQGIGSC